MNHELRTSLKFRPQLPLPVIGLTTWLFGCFGVRVGARPMEMLKQVRHDVVLLAFAVAVTMSHELRTSLKFRSQLHLPVIGLTTWLYRC